METSRLKVENWTVVRGHELPPLRQVTVAIRQLELPLLEQSRGSSDRSVCAVENIPSRKIFSIAAICTAGSVLSYGLINAFVFHRSVPEIPFY
jgi:hypothetical protein